MKQCFGTGPDGKARASRDRSNEIYLFGKACKAMVPAVFGHEDDPCRQPLIGFGMKSGFYVYRL